MALVVNDRVKETSTTTGTGTLTLDGAVTGFETFSSAIGNTNTTYYAIELPNTAEFEVGLGTVSAGQLARTTVISSSNSDALVNFSAGTKNVFCTLPASKAVIEDASNNVTLPADLTVDTNTLHVDSSNNRVGINDSTPSQALDVSGRSRSTRFVSSTGGAAADAAFYLNDTNGLGIFSPATNTFSISTSASERLRIDSSGNVGIGTSSPGALLDVTTPDTASLVDALNLDNPNAAGNGVAISFFQNNNRKAKIKSYYNATTQWNIGFDTEDTTDALTIIDNGNIGIGTTSPSTLLHLSSSDPQITITDTDGTGSQVIKAVGNNLELVSANQTVLNSASTIFLDSNNGRVAYNVGATEYMRVSKSTDSAVIKSSISDGDLIFKGNDGGSEINALHFDMSDSGFAEFNSKIRVEADTSANAILVKGRSADDIGTIKFTANDGSGNQAELSARSSVFILNTPTQTNFRINNTDKLILTSSQVNLKDTVFVDANEQIQFGDAGENISGDGTSMTISSSSNINLDAAGGITLDAGTSGIKLDDDGSTIGLLYFLSGNLNIKPSQSDTDLVIKGNDGGSEITALTLDMSEAGAATFNDKVILGVDKRLELGDAGEYIYGDGTNLQFVSSNAVGFDAANSITLDGGSGGTILKAGGGTTYGSLINSSGDLIIKSGTTTALTFSGANVTVAGNLDVSSGTIKLDGNYPTGNNNVALGDNALDSVTTGGNDNTIIGDNAGTAVTTGYQNTAVGSTALNTGNATGNTAIGFRALRRATGANNTGIGRSAGDDTTTGGQNTFVGSSAGYYINGLNNVAVGYQAGSGFGNTGSSNIFMGYRAGDNITSGSNNIVIGTNIDASSATVSNEITLGDANITSLRIPGLQSGASSGDVLTYDGTNITLSTPSTGVSAGFSIAMAIAL